jgi:hypothetical protein
VAIIRKIQVHDPDGGTVMDIFEILDQVIDLLRRDGRVT